MQRVIPETKQRSEERVPKWLNIAAVVEAAKSTLQRITKTAAVVAPATVVTEYVNVRTGKRYFASTPVLVKQAGEEKKDPTTGEVLSVYKRQATGLNTPSPRFAKLEERNADLQRGDVNNTTGQGTYNTFVDRHLTFKMVNALQLFASKNGMSMPTVTFLRSEHAKMAGQEYPALNTALCKLEFMYAPRLKARVFASIGIDESGNYVFPRVFTTVDGTNIPFEKRSVTAYMKSFTVHQRQPIMRQKKSDIPTYKRPDITRFRAVSASKTADFGDNAMHPDMNSGAPGHRSFDIAGDTGGVPGSEFETCPECGGQLDNIEPQSCPECGYTKEQAASSSSSVGNTPLVGNTPMTDESLIASLLKDSAYSMDAGPNDAGDQYKREQEEYEKSLQQGNSQQAPPASNTSGTM